MTTPLHDEDVHVGAPRILTVFLPLIAVVVPQWLRVLKQRDYASQAGPPSKKVLVLVSGAGQPRDIKANPHDNSTEGTGQIIAQFIQAVYPDIEVRHVSSSDVNGIFRYDDNVRFVKSEVLPVIDAERTLALRAFGEDWPKKLNVTMCLADGPPVRISAMQAALRSYRPGYLHVWRLKTFWDERVVAEEDVEFHNFKELEMRPPVHRSQLQGEMRALVEDMLRYRRQFEAVRDLTRQSDAGEISGVERHELDTFWLRKTRKVVMAVLLTKKSGVEDRPVFWRGMNVEVSMPTGTLCAERNAISNALAGDQTLRRTHLQGVAVLSLTLDRDSGEVLRVGGLSPSDHNGGGEVSEVALNPLDPCGACMEWLKKVRALHMSHAHASRTRPEPERTNERIIARHGHKP